MNFISENIKNYMFSRHLTGSLNIDMTEERVKEIYHEMFKQDPFPESSKIAAILDEENLVAIDRFCDSEGYDLDEMEIAYLSEISCFLDDVVEWTLSNLHYPYTPSSLSTQIYIGSDQAILIPQLVPRGLMII